MSLNPAPNFLRAAAHLKVLWLAIPAIAALIFLGLLGHWAFWTRRAVEQHAACRKAARSGRVPGRLLRLAAEITDANGAVFDAAHRFAGCIPGIHEILRRQGLLRGRWCLDPREDLSPGQRAEIDRVCRAYPRLADDQFVARHLDDWLR